MVNGNLAHQFVTSPGLKVAIDEMPVKWCTISLSEMVKRGKRLEASVYDVEAKQAHELLWRENIQSLCWEVKKD